jgi:hypothetical protein
MYILCFLPVQRNADNDESFFSHFHHCSSTCSSLQDLSCLRHLTERLCATPQRTRSTTYAENTHHCNFINKYTRLYPLCCISTLYPNTHTCVSDLVSLLPRVNTQSCPNRAHKPIKLHFTEGAHIQYLPTLSCRQTIESAHHATHLPCA